MTDQQDNSNKPFKVKFVEFMIGLSLAVGLWLLYLSYPGQDALVPLAVGLSVLVFVAYGLKRRFVAIGIISAVLIPAAFLALAFGACVIVAIFK
jgi:hypothetical protein